MDPPKIAPLSSSSSSSSLCKRHVIVFFTFVLTLVPFHTSAEVTDQKDTYEFGPNAHCISQSSSFASEPAFTANLNTLVSSISSQPSNPYGFYNFSVGDTSDQRVNAIGLCRRELTPQECLNCISEAARNLTGQLCQTKEAVVFYLHCMFRYANRVIYGNMETTPVWVVPNPNNTTAKADEFVRLQSKLLNTVRGMAAAGGDKRKYAQASGSAVSPYTRFFATAQCTPDLSEKDCNDCLLQGLRNVSDMQLRVGKRWFCPSCKFQIESDWQFYQLEYEPDGPSGTDSPAPPPPGKGDNTLKVILSTTIPVISVTVIVASLWLFLKMKKRQSKLDEEGLIGPSNDLEDNLPSSNSLQQDFDTIKAATNDFSPDNQLGEGGFGAVYKGVLDNGQEIAVKRLSANSGQGDHEFINELTLLAKLQHRNLVRLLGFCLQGEERLLIYEFFRNTSLDRFIFDPHRQPFLDWEMRYKMIVGIARGLLYLHEDSRFRIIHRDLKASNILLDGAMNPKIADFGMAKLFDTDQTTQQYTSKIGGTIGYMAPEYVTNGQFSVKTDVFSFGVLLLEIVTGKRNNWSPDEESSVYLLGHAWRCWREGTISGIVDTRLSSSSTNEISRCIQIGLLCVQGNPKSRPTIASVAVMLNSYSVNLPTPSQPTSYVGSSDESSKTNRGYSRGSTEETISASRGGSPTKTVLE